MTKPTESFSILDKGLIFEGTISSVGKLVIKGTVKGNLSGEAIVIGEEGSVYAEMKAKSITIGGTFEGKVNAGEALIILSTGICEGKVICRDLVVEPGGILNAEVTSTAIQNSSIPENKNISSTTSKKG